jgi:type IV pilus assembly protein PilE
MITVAVAAILAAVALPMYTVYVQRSKIAEAVSSLSDMRSRLEQYFFDNGRYPGACVAAGPGPAAAGTIYLPTNNQYFAVGCALPSATSYTVTATGTATGGMSSFSYTIDQDNTRRTAALPSTWAGAGSTCWVMKRDGSC